MVLYELGFGCLCFFMGSSQRLPVCAPRDARPTTGVTFEQQGSTHSVAAFGKSQGSQGTCLCHSWCFPDFSDHGILFLVMPGNCMTLGEYRSILFLNDSVGFSFKCLHFASVLSLVPWVNDPDRVEVRQ